MSKVLSSIEGIAAYPVISLVVFVSFFVAVVILVSRMKKDHIDRMSRLPLE